MGIKYNKGKVQKALMVNALCDRLEGLEDKYERDLKKFKYEINEQKIRLSFEQIKELDNVQKAEYMKAIFGDGDDVEFYLETVQGKVEERQDEVKDLMVSMDQTKEIWDDYREEVNQKVTARCQLKGINSKSFNKKFTAFNILDICKQLKSCIKCSQGKECEIHKIT